MTMRADIERNSASGDDAYGSPIKPVFGFVGNQSCYVYSKQRREVVDGDKTAMVEDMRALFPFGSWIKEGDEISNITDRQSVVTMPGRFQIETIQPKRRHLEVGLLRVQS